jgi:hypothetical protein
MEIVDGVPPHAGEDGADARERARARAGRRLMRLGGLAASQGQSRAPVVGGSEPRAVPRDALLDGRLRPSCGHPVPVGLVGQLRADLREVVLTLGMLAMGQPLGPLTPERPAAPAQSAGGAQLSGLHRGLRAPAAAQAPGDRVGVNRLVRGLAPMAGWQGAGGAQDAGTPRLGATVGEPGPR